jgi:hypothetical protein
MRLFKYIFSIVGALTIVFCSIAQFHHHSEDGQMIVYTLNCDINNHLSQHSHNYHKKTHDKEQSCSHDCHDGHKQEDKSCALKINIVNIEKEDVNHFIFCCDIFNEIGTYHEDTPVTIPHYYYLKKDDFHKIGAGLMRAPPMV